MARLRAFILLIGFGFTGLACRAPAPTRRDAARPPAATDDTKVADRFKDTTRDEVTRDDGRTFHLRTRGERDSFRAVLRTERALWRKYKPREYQFLLRVDCFCPGRRGWLLIEVRSGPPLLAFDTAGKATALAEWNTFSIDTLFDKLERAADMDGVVQVAFDPRWHFPADVRTIRLPGPDAWTIIDVRDVRPLTGGR